MTTQLETVNGGTPECAVCTEEHAHLVMEWRGVDFHKPICPICANKIAVEIIRKEDKAEREAKVLL